MPTGRTCCLLSQAQISNHIARARFAASVVPPHWQPRDAYQPDYVQQESRPEVSGIALLAGKAMRYQPHNHRRADDCQQPYPQRREHPRANLCHIALSNRCHCVANSIHIVFQFPHVGIQVGRPRYMFMARSPPPRDARVHYYDYVRCDCRIERLGPAHSAEGRASP